MEEGVIFWFRSFFYNNWINLVFSQNLQFDPPHTPKCIDFIRAIEATSRNFKHGAFVRQAAMSS